MTRLAAVRKLAEAGVYVHVNIAPIIPAITDHRNRGDCRGGGRAWRVERVAGYRSACPTKSRRCFATGSTFIFPTARPR